GQTSRCCRGFTARNQRCEAHRQGRPEAGDGDRGRDGWQDFSMAAAPGLVGPARGWNVAIVGDRGRCRMSAIALHILADLAVWAVLSVALGLFVGAFIRVGGSSQ